MLRRDTRPVIDAAHGWAAACWLVSVVTSPAIEGVAYAVLAVAALIRWPECVRRLRESATLRLTLFFYLATVGWACASSLWRPEGASASLSLRVMLVPLLLVHAPLSMRTLRWAACAGGVAWAVILL
ncbi:MAG: hypothetical protein O2855_06390, partial [Planctomycetota bacterium]|nr:hypothetical protein [Planctomycetota bacterium]